MPGYDYKQAERDRLFNKEKLKEAREAVDKKILENEGVRAEDGENIFENLKADSGNPKNKN